MTIRILFDQDLVQDTKLLDQAWSAPETFALVPAKSGVELSWVQKSLEKLPSDLAQRHFILLTSGSTGLPKLVVGSRTRAEKLVEVLNTLQDAEPVKEAIVTLPLTYCYSFVNQWLWARRFNRRLVLTHGLQDPSGLQQALSRAQNAQICLVGIQLPLLTRHFSGTTFPGLIRVHFAGGRFPQEQLPEVRRLFPNASIFNNYGCTEAMPRLTLRRAEDSDSAGDVGKPLPGVALKSDAQGMLVFQSPYSAVAFIDSDGFHSFLPQEWISTGDLGNLDAQGRCQITGRAGDVFKRHGEKISLASLQKTISACWTGQSAFYRDTDANGEQSHILVLSPPPTKEDINRVLSTLGKNHPRTQWPLRLESMTEFPMLPNGKVDALSLANLTGKTIHWAQRY